MCNLRVSRAISIDVYTSLVSSQSYSFLGILDSLKGNLLSQHPRFPLPRPDLHGSLPIARAVPLGGFYPIDQIELRRHAFRLTPNRPSPYCSPLPIPGQFARGSLVIGRQSIPSEGFSCCITRYFCWPKPVAGARNQPAPAAAWSGSCPSPLSLSSSG